MERLRKVIYQNREREGAEVEFKIIKEDWNEYNLDDGTRIKLKPIAVNFIRIKDEFDNEGEPVYLVKASNVLSVSAPENLKRGAEEKSEVH